jgi:hypothetical protein
MTTLMDVTPDLPPADGLAPVRERSAAEVSTLAEELLAYQQHFAPLFQRREQREWAALYLRGVLTADVPRKNVEALALRRLWAGPHAQRQVRAVQQFVGEGGWDDEALLAEHQRLVQETLGEEEGVFIIAGAEFPKHGSHSVGVAPQWCGPTGKQEHCQAGVFLGYASRKGATLLDRRLYLPESWFKEDHQPLWHACRIPQTSAFPTTHDLAAQLVEQVIVSGQITAQWVLCDQGYGDSPAFLDRLARAGVWYLAEVPRDTQIWPLLQADGQTPRPLPSSWVPPQTKSHKGPAPRRERRPPSSPAKVPVEELAKPWPAPAWQRFRLLEGHKGPLVADFLALRAVLPRDRLPGPEQGVVLRRKVSGPAEEPEWKF